ncbi:hypothetical protein HNR23_000601 [Nocardiopsis mwathae]|uniref:Uncharacterized protein n=1 Tax=Nocardiopsis mwathae TaxID=1472723 RepID=A0A7X0D4A2_9ACTN|nr:hypothetical protein [Nocardiopsis mwathae]MBB6170541.1 hypothetical protein [Nocardiopsis mwathae]
MTTGARREGTMARPSAFSRSGSTATVSGVPCRHRDDGGVAGWRRGAAPEGIDFLRGRAAVGIGPPPGRLSGR